MSSRVLICCLIFAIGLGFDGPSPALSADRTELLIREGVELRKQGKNQEAAERFAKAYEQSHTPRAAAQLGLCEQALERWVEAELHLSEALTGASDPWVAKNRKVLNETLEKARSKLSLLLIEGKDAAQVHVNGEYVGNLPDKQSIRVLPGLATVTATAAGYLPFEEKVTAVAGKSHTLTVTLTAQPATIAAPTLETNNGPGTEPSMISTAGNTPPAHSSHTWLWIGGAAVATALAVGIIVLATSGTNYPSADATRDFPPRQ